MSRPKADTALAYQRELSRDLNIMKRRGKVTRASMHLPRAEASGIEDNSATGAGSSAPIFWNTPVTITFPVGLFDPALPVVVGVTVEALGNVAWCSLVGVPSATSCQVRTMRVGATPTADMRIHWIATQGE
jgi:hypothetical protein